MARSKIAHASASVAEYQGFCGHLGLSVVLTLTGGKSPIIARAYRVRIWLVPLIAMRQYLWQILKA